MQPQIKDAQPAPPTQFDFILKDQPKTQKKFSLPSFGGRGPTKILYIAIAAFVLVVVIAVVASQLNKTDSSQLVDLMARSQEISRVSQEAGTQLTSPDTKALSTTVDQTMASTQGRLSAYLAKSKIKVSSKTLAKYMDKNTDSQLQAAAQNNNLDSAYVGYLRTNLATYQTNLQNLYKATKSSSQKTIFNDSFSSNYVILNSSLVKS